VEDLRSATLTTLKAGRLPIALGGEHSIAIGGISAALAHTQGNLAVLWIDAHADINTPATSPSGSLHGMPLGALTSQCSGVDGLVDAQWLSLIHAATAEHCLESNRIAWLGLREVDPGEAAYITGSSGCLTLTMHDIDRRGLVASVDRFDEWMKATGVRNLWISFDVDVLDPILAPGTGTAVRGGLTYREGHLMAELLREKLDDGPYKLVGLDVVEVNPLEDTANSTAKIVVEWVASLFGKTILGCPAR
jgi:arginase